MVSSLNDDKLDFRISFDESDDEDYTVIYDKNSFSYKIISANDLKTNSKNDNDKVNMPLFPSPEPLVSCIDDLDFFKDFKNEFSAIVYNDALTSKSDFSTETTLCPQHIDEFNLKDETSLSEYKDNDDKIDIKQSSGDMSIIPLPNVINTDVGAYACINTTYPGSLEMSGYAVLNAVNTAYKEIPWRKLREEIRIEQNRTKKITRETLNFDEPKPQPNPLPKHPYLDASLEKERGFEPPKKPYSSDGFRMNEVDHLIIHTLPSPHMASFHHKGTYCYYHPCIDDPKKHYGFKPGLLGYSGSLGVDFSNMEMIENEWELEAKEVYFLERGLNSTVWPKEVENFRIKETHYLEHTIQQQSF
nr:hypothetical protein [Tanacetum cinerariifolium]